MSLAKRTIHGAAWVTLSTVIAKLTDFLTKILLARLLVPEDFGTLAIGLLIINSMDILKDLGFGNALIYRKKDTDYNDAANTAFLLIPVTAFTLFIIAYFLAHKVALFFNNVESEPVIKILALTFLISSFGTVPSMLLEKELEFKRKLVPETIPKLGYSLVTIFLAIYGFGVWSLVFGQIISSILSVVLTWMVSDWKPSFKFSKRMALELFEYGKHVMNAGILIFIIMNIDNVIVGKLLGAESLGFYMMAFTISNMPATQITFLIGRVMFPTYSKLQDDKIALKKAYIKTLRFVSMLTIPASLGILIIAPEFVSVVLKDKWLPAVPAIQILCIFGLLRSIAATFGPLYQATGKPKILLNFSFLQLTLLTFFILPLTKNFGIFGTGLATTLSLLIVIFIHFIEAGKIIDETPISIFKTLFVPILNSILMLIGIICLKYIYSINSFQSFLVSIFIGIIIYLILNIFNNKKYLESIMETINL